MREQHLFTAVDKFLANHSRWVSSDDQLLTNAFEASLIEMIDEFSAGDLPQACRALAAAVSVISDEWTKYEGYVTQANPNPRDSFWAAVESLAKEREGSKPVERRPIEPVKMLIEQKVSPNQICLIYAHQGVGPFMKNGVPQPHLVYQELENPGSIIPKEWTHPADEARMAEARKVQRLRLERLADRQTKRPVAPETTEELLRQGVTPRQIADMKQIDVGEVYRVARAIGVDPEKWAATLSPWSQGRNPIAEMGAGSVGPGNVGEPGAGPGNVVEFYEGDEAEADGAGGEGDDMDSLSSESAAAPASVLSDDELKGKILELAATGRSSMEIARELGCSVQKAAQIIRHGKRDAEVAVAAATG